jgi:dipeptidyl aminopeptidase/acylaminoacyl peptidase
MSWTQGLLTRLPDRWQDRILARVIASNRWRQVPTFHMLFESYVLMGADRDDLISVFSSATDLGGSLYRHARRVALQRERSAEGMVRDDGEARAEYQRALMLYFLADWVTFEEQAVAENYHDLLRVSARIDELGGPATQKVNWPWPEGHVAVRVRYPSERPESDAGVPAVVLVQGNDTVKETLLHIEDELVSNGLAVVNVDQAGWGESRLSGNRYRSLEDARLLGERCISFCEQDAAIDPSRVALFGFSGGGTWAAMLAGTNARFRWLVTVGGAIYDLGESVRRLPAMQKRQVMKHWGCREAEIEGMLRELALNELLPNITARCLLVHGEQDTLVPVQNVRAAAKLIAGPVDLHVVPGGDHMCSATLKDEQLPYIVSWLRTNLVRAA